MPHMDGLTLAKKINSDIKFDTKPFILMFSSLEKNDIIKQGREAGIDRYLAKPVKMNDLFDLLSQIKSNTYENNKPLEIKIEESNINLADKTILIAEDNALNMKLMKAMLIKTGAKIISAENGSQVIEYFKNNHIDIILMDVHMPVIDGFQATKIIRETEDNNKHIPIVALTANALKGDREKCLENGMDDYLSKPFKKNDLYEILKKHLLPKANEQEIELIDSISIFNKQAFLNTVGNNYDLFNEIIEDFKRIFMELFNKLNIAIKQSNLNQIEYCAHALKGMCSNISALELKNISDKIEILSKDKTNIAEIEVLALHLEKGFEKILPLLNE